MSELLSTIQSPADLHKLDDAELHRLAQEMRDELVRVLSIRPAHFASNLGVVELCLALHLTFDFSRDRLIWGHRPSNLSAQAHHRPLSAVRQHPHARRPHGLPQPAREPLRPVHDRPRRLQRLGRPRPEDRDELLGQGDRHSVAVVGDGALPSGIVFEALNNAGHLNRNLLVILNDNKMSICPRVGALAQCLDRARLTRFYQGSKRKLRRLLSNVPVVGGMAQQALEQLRDGMKALVSGGQLFEELGFRYIGPVDGHDLPALRRWLGQIKNQPGPVLLHVLTEKGHGVAQASEDPVTYHTPPVFEKVGPERTILSLKRGGSRAYTDAISAAIYQEMTDNPRVTVMTAAMCQGNKLEKVRTEFADRFFDVGICESHAVAFAAGQAKAVFGPLSIFIRRFCSARSIKSSRKWRCRICR